MDNRFSRDQVKFKQAYRCIPFSKSKISDLECGDKIVMPVSALQIMMDREIPYPWLFQIKKYNNPGRVSHCGVLEFTADEGSILVPDWKMENLNLKEGELVAVENALLPKGKYMKLQPHSTRFIELTDPKAVLEKNLGNFSCLSTGDTIMINHNDEKFYINILETKPGTAICLIGTDCEADFAVPLHYKEPGKPAKVEQNAQAEKVQKNEIKEIPKFRPFIGKGRRLDGEPVEMEVNRGMVKDDNAPTSGGGAGGSNGVDSTIRSARKRKGTIVFGSNSVEKIPKRSSDGSRSKDGDLEDEEKQVQKFQPFMGKKYVLDIGEYAQNRIYFYSHSFE